MSQVIRLKLHMFGSATLYVFKIKIQEKYIYCCYAEALYISLHFRPEIILAPPSITQRALGHKP